MNRRRFSWKRLPLAGRILLGCFLLLLGLLGLFLPILQGILFLALGVSVLAYDIPWIGRRWERLLALVKRRRKRGP